MAEALQLFANSFFGQGVIKTTLFPSPFPITLSGTVLGGSVGQGAAYDANGKFTSINDDTTGSPNFTIPAADPAFSRWDLLVIRYKQVGDTAAPKPSDPLTTISLNLHDDFELAVIPGTPSASPAYPSKSSEADIILAGIIVPYRASLGTACAIDTSIRELGHRDRVQIPQFRRVPLIGMVNGENKAFDLPAAPITPGSVLIFWGNLLEHQAAEYTINGTRVIFADAPRSGQEPSAWMLIDSESSLNPLVGQQGPLIGTVDGVNDTFAIPGTPADRNSSIVFTDGTVEDAEGWELIQGFSESKIKFKPGYIPQLGQKPPYIFFFVNPATIGVAPNPGAVANATNLNSEGFGLFKDLLNGILGFKTLVAGANISIEEGEDQLVLSAAGGGSGSGYAPQYHTITATEVTAKKFQLSHTPSNPANVVLEIRGSVPQFYEDDYSIDGNYLIWDGLGLDDGSMEEGTRCRVLFL